MRTVGIEEELLIVGVDDKRPFAAGDVVVADAATRHHDPQFEAEFKQEQAELGSSPSESIAALGAELQDLRTQMMASARRQNAEVVAIASSPFKVRPTMSAGERYAEMTEKFGLLARQQLTCGQHVHVSIASPEEGVAILDRIRPWLSVLTAISGNSPFWHGEDSGYASYRSVMWGLWPTAGPTEAFGDVEVYELAMQERLASGAAMDTGMLYFDARLSSHYPTVEIRVPDVCTDIGDALLIAALARGLVDTAAAEWAAGIAPDRGRVGLLRAAAWRAARSGLGDDLVDVAAVQAIPAFQLLDKLTEHIGDALTSNGDADRVQNAIARITEVGTGSEYQRRSFAKRSRLIDVVQDAAERTVAGGSVDD